MAEEKLRVRRRVWPEPDKPKTQLYNGKEWEPCRDLEAARTYARRHGYAGIAIEPL